MDIAALKRRRVQHHDAARDRAPLFAAQTNRRIAIAALGAQLLQGGGALLTVGITALTQPPQRMADALVAAVVDIVGGQDM